jgi:4'-phosphopantetheinyl transferase
MPLVHFTPESGTVYEQDPGKENLLFLTSVPDELPAGITWLPEEIEKSILFRKEEDRTAYLYRRHLMRRLLGHFLKKSPDELIFTHNPFGKPEIDDAPFHFNMSRSGKEIAFYFGPFPGGVDIEKIRPSGPFRVIADIHYHPAEQENAKNDTGFFTTWTRKEAILKAIGTGLVSNLIDVDTTNDEVTVLQQKVRVNSLQTDNSILSCASLSVENHSLRLFNH